MQLIQKLKAWPQLLVLSMLLCVAQTAPVLASTGDAYFTLSPSSGSHTVGSTFSVAVYETSSGSDNTEGVTANLSYNASLLQYESSSAGAFSICTENSGGGGSIGASCASTTTLSGTQTVLSITFKALGSGTASVSMVGSGATPTDIENSSTQSVWNGSLPAASFSLSNPSSGSSGTSSHSSSGSASSKPSTTPSSTTTSTPKPPTTTTTKSTTPSTTTTAQPALAAVTIIVVDANGQPVKGATVVLDGKVSVTTDSQGKANFPAEHGGLHAVTITDPGKKPYSTKVSLTAGQSIPIEMQLTDAKSSSWLYIVLVLIGVMVLIGVGLWFFRPKRSWFTRVHEPAQITPTPVASSAAPTPQTDQQPGSVPPHAETRQNRSFYLRRRDSFDGIRGRH